LSSILDYLKKLEKETSQRHHPLLHARTDGKAGIPKRAIGIIGGICICVGAIGLAAYYQAGTHKIPEPLATVAVPAPKPVATLEATKKPLAPSPDTPAALPARSTNRKATASPAISEIKTADSESIAKPIIPDSESAERNVKAEPEQVVAIKKPPKEEPVEIKALPEPEPQGLTAKNEDNSDSPDALSEKTLEQKEKPLPIDRLEGVGLKIQAISWREISGESLAVINNQVLREGDGIEGYQISRINPDDIILQRGGKAYRLEFRSTGAL